ncbi:MAG: NUDIX domain-containing protein [Acidimicrobiia bacterium]
MSPLPAASLILVRDGAGSVEVLMGRRPDRGTFGGAWVFPGGVVEEADRDAALTGVIGADAAWRAAAIRETAEETGIFVTDPPGVRVPDLHGAAFYEELSTAGARVAGDRLHYLSNWITPLGVPRRFDTRFYLTPLAEDADPGGGSEELSDVAWIDPVAALASHETGDRPLILVTAKHLEHLARFATVVDLLAELAARPAPGAVEPVLVTRADGSWQALLPGDHGYEEAMGVGL